MGGNALQTLAATVRDALATPSLPRLSIAATAIAGKLRPPPLPSARPLGRSESPWSPPQEHAAAQAARDAAKTRAQLPLQSETPAVREAATCGDAEERAHPAQHAKAQAEAEERAWQAQLARSKAQAEAEERAWQAQRARAKAQADIEERTWQALLQRAKARAEQGAWPVQRTVAQTTAADQHRAPQTPVRAPTAHNRSPAEPTSAPRELADPAAQAEEGEWQALRARAQAAWEREGGAASRQGCGAAPSGARRGSLLPWDVVLDAARPPQPAIVVWP